MMQRREASALVAAVVCTLVAVGRIASGRDVTSRRVSDASGASARVSVVSDDSLDAAAANTVANDPFRLVNHPSTVRYDARTEGGIGAPAPFVPLIRPQLVLRAIIGGPPWQAIVDGIPGQQPGSIVGSGVVFEKLTVRSVGKDTVVIQGPDTLWKLTLTQGGP